MLVAGDRFHRLAREVILGFVALREVLDVENTLAIDVFLGDDQALLEVTDYILLFRSIFRGFGHIWQGCI